MPTTAARTKARDKAPGGISVKSLPFIADTKDFNEATGDFSGYLSRYTEDKVGDVVEPGAFSKTLNDAYQSKEARQAPFLFPVLWQHDQHQPVGGFYDMREDEKGLFVKGWLDLDTELGKRAYSGLKHGYLGGLSIGYRTIKSNTDKKGVRHLTELALIEGSVVTFPANPDAVVPMDSVKSEELEAVEQKEGRVLSAANHAKISDMIKGIREHLNELEAHVGSLHKPLEPDQEDQDEGEPEEAPNTPEDEPGPSTKPKKKEDEDTLNDIVTSMHFSMLLADMRKSIKH